MQRSTRRYRVGGLTFSVSLEAPYSFMDYTPAVRERIDAASRGEVVPILPTRAGDRVPERTYVRSREELPENFGAHVLDFSQYEPFFIAEEASQDDIFHLSVLSEKPSWVGSDKLQTMLRVEDELPCFYIYNLEGETVIEYDASRGNVVAYLKISKDYSQGEFYADPGLKSYRVLFHLTTALMMMYTYNCAGHGALLMHASVVRHDGLANVFFGTSGTGKSTHSRLWLEHIPSTDLLNDDNPVLRVENGETFVYGSPWSGKTPCYRNVRVKVGKIVNLHQAPENTIVRIIPLKAFAGVLSSSSSIRWDHQIMNHINKNASDIAMSVPCFNLGCLPDADAAKVCQSAQ